MGTNSSQDQLASVLRYNQQGLSHFVQLVRNTYAKQASAVGLSVWGVT